MEESEDFASRADLLIIFLQSLENIKDKSTGTGPTDKAVKGEGFISCDAMTCMLYSRWNL
jgi:hypothetical protein